MIDLVTGNTTAAVWIEEDERAVCIFWERDNPGVVTREIDGKTLSRKPATGQAVAEAVGWVRDEYRG